MRGRTLTADALVHGDDCRCFIHCVAQQETVVEDILKMRIFAA